MSAGLTIMITNIFSGTAAVAGAGASMKAMGLALSTAFKATALAAGILIAKVLAIAAVFFLAFNALRKFFDLIGLFPILTAEQKKYNKAVRQGNAASEAAIPGLRKRLELLNAETEFEKEVIKLGHEANIVELILIRNIINRNKEIKEEIALRKELDAAHKRSQDAMEATIGVNDRIRILKLQLGGATEKELALAEEEIRLKIALSKFGEDATMQELLMIKLLQDEHDLIVKLIGLGGDKEKVLKTSMEKWEMYNNQLASTISSIDAMNNAEVSQARDRELRNAEGIISEEARRRRIDEINEKYDKKGRDRAAKMRLWKIGSAISNTALAMTQVMADETIKPSWLKFPLMTMMAIEGVAQIQAIQAQQFALGADYVTSGPQMIMVGDNPGGKERVQVTPLSSPNIEGPSGSSITVNVSGNVMSQDFVEGELAEQIKEAVRRGTDFGIG